MTLLAGFAASFAAFAALSLAMERHHGQVFGRAPRVARRLAWRCTGWVLLVVSLLLCVAGFGTGIGLVVWCGVSCAAGLLVAWTLPYRPRWLLRGVAVSVIVALVATGSR